MRNEKIVGRAELKLEDAVKAFGYDFRGKMVLDIGSSTGGFTELVLRKGAKGVIAIEKGTKQMKAPLRYDKRIELHEKTDFLLINTTRRVHYSSSDRMSSQPVVTGAKHPTLSLVSSESSSDEQLHTPNSIHPLVKVDSGNIDLSKIEVVVADVSFVSLRKILEHAIKILPRKVDYLVMLKPQFEAFPDQLVNGVVKNEKMRREIMGKFEEWLKRKGLVVVKKRDNDVRGKIGGNRERFYWLKRTQG